MSEEQMKVVYSMVIGQGIITLVLLMAQRNLHQQAYWILILNVVAMQFSLWQRFIGIVSKFFNFVRMPCLFGLYALCAVKLRVYFVNNYFPVNSVWKVAIKKAWDRDLIKYGYRYRIINKTSDNDALKGLTV